MINGKVVTLKAIEREDLTKLLEWRNNPDFRKHFREYRELTKAQQEDWYASLSDDPNTLMFSIWRKDEMMAEELIGACGITHIYWHKRFAELSVYIGKNNLYLDNTYAVDAWETLMRYGFRELGMNKLWVECYAFDEARIALCKHFGFHLDGTLRENAYHDGRFFDSLIYSKLAREYRSEAPHAEIQR